MTKKNSNKTQQEIEAFQRTAQLVRGLLEQDVPEQMKQKLRAWFKSGASEKEKYAALESLLAELKENLRPDQYDYSQLLKLHDILGFPHKVYIQKPQRRTTALRRRLALRIAAVVIPAMLIVGGAYLWIERANDTIEHQAIAYVSVSAAANTQKHLILPDSSEVWLNASSSIKYPDNFNSNRVVELEGEAYFSVRKAAGATFSVRAAGLMATVLGTQFNVKASGPQTEITLDKGSIQVEAGKKEYLLTPGERLIADKTTDQVRVEVAAPDDGTWRSGMEFSGNSLHEILTAIAAHFNLEIEIVGSLPDDNIRFGFDYDASPEMILSVLKNANAYFTYQISGGKIIITANGKNI